MLLQGPSYLQGYKRQASSRVLYQLGQQLTSLGSFTFTLACRGPFPRQIICGSIGIAGHELILQTGHDRSRFGAMTVV
jgi:hypothetical protein